MKNYKTMSDHFLDSLFKRCVILIYWSLQLFIQQICNGKDDSTDFIWETFNFIEVSSCFTLVNLVSTVNFLFFQIIKSFIWTWLPWCLWDSALVEMKKESKRGVGAAEMGLGGIYGFSKQRDLSFGLVHVQ